ASIDGSFSFTGTVDGSYDFYTRAHDNAGNYEAAPALADSSTPVDTQDHTSSASSPAYSTSTTFTVTYGASDPLKDGSNSGLKDVELCANAPGPRSFPTRRSSDLASIDGSFSFTGTVDGSYDFYTRAHDNAGNYEAAPALADTSTLVDTQGPAEYTSAPASPASLTFPLTSRASDPLNDGSNTGLNIVVLCANAPDPACFPTLRSSGLASIDGSFSFTGTVDGSYDFYTRAHDNAGNYEAAPALADTSTLVDTQ